GNRRKPTTGFLRFPHPLGNPANPAGFPHFHRADCCFPLPTKNKNKKGIGRFAASSSGFVSGSPCIGNAIPFQDHPRIGKCSEPATRSPALRLRLAPWQK